MTFRTALTASTTGAAFLATGLALAPAAVAADVNRPPTHVIVGAEVLSHPVGATRDEAGRLYVANDTDPSIQVFGPDAGDNATPLRTIEAGTRTPKDVAVDDEGYLYVANSTRITVYAPTANGDDAPVREISGDETELDRAHGIDVDTDGTVYVTDHWDDQVLVFAPGANGDDAPIRVISGDATRLYSPQGIDLAPSGRLYVTNYSDQTVTSYPKNASGDTPPVRLIEGRQTQLSYPYGVQTDSAGRVYVTNTDDPDDGYSSITVYGAGTTGNQPPLTRLAGPATQLDGPHGLTLDATNRVTVTDRRTESVLTFAPLYPKVTTTPPTPKPKPKPKVTRPGRVGTLKVRGASKAVRWSATWKRPARTGNARVDRYSVVVHLGRSRVHAEMVRGGRAVLTRRELAHRGKLRFGTYRVTVKAHNVKGWGPGAAKRFRVKRR